MNKYILNLSDDVTAAVKKVVTSARARGQKLHVTASSSRSAHPTIYFLTPDFRRPSGGIRVIYRHVDILTGEGISAAVLHQSPRFRCDWFENSTRITNVSDAVVRRGDLLVISELDVAVIGTLPKGIRYAIFNQNAHMTWERQAAHSKIYAPNPELAGIVTVSDHNLEMLSFAYPACRIERVHLGIDQRLFHCGAANRPRRITYMPRRGRDDAMQVLEILRARGTLEGWEIVPLDGLSQEKVADELRRSRIFLAFTHQEGFGLPAAEAMACGCYVVGNHGFGGTEFFRSEFSKPVQVGDVLNYAQSVEDAVATENRNEGWCAEKGLIASKTIREMYSQAKERDDVLRLYRGFMQENEGTTK